MTKTVSVALGGSAILQPGQAGIHEERSASVDAAMYRITQLVEDGWRVVLTHGNGFPRSARISLRPCSRQTSRRMPC